jgi:hypothetical protein
MSEPDYGDITENQSPEAIAAQIERADKRRRLQRARCAIGSHRQYCTQDVEEAITDVVTDQLHLAAHKGLDVDALLERARRHFDAEEAS